MSQIYCTFMNLWFSVANVKLSFKSVKSFKGLAFMKTYTLSIQGSCERKAQVGARLPAC